MPMQTSWRLRYNVISPIPVGPHTSTCVSLGFCLVVSDHVGLMSLHFHGLFTQYLKGHAYFLDAIGQVRWGAS
jgi:hypothetical protein